MFELDLDFNLDEIHVDTLGKVEEKNKELPPVYLYLENLVMMNQVKGLVENEGDLVTVPTYAEKGGKPEPVGIIELTSENVLTMQQLGLRVTLVREGKSDILFDKPDDYVAIIKTLKEGDTIAVDDIDVHNSDGELHGG